MEHSIREITQKEFERVEFLFEENYKELKVYADLLMWWNQKINLISRDVSRETVLNHIKHSLFISLSTGFSIGTVFFDTGAGGGLPGLPLGVCFKEKDFIINDIVTKKIFAVNDMINKLSLNETVRGKTGDVCDIDFEQGTTVITKHAFKVEQLYEMIKDKPWERIIFLKGFKEGIEEASKIKEPVEIDIIKLDSKFMGSFYHGKGIVELRRGKDE